MPFSGSDFVDSPERMTALLDAIAPELRKKFLEMIARVRDQLPSDSIIRMVEEGRLVDAEVAFESGMNLFQQDIASAFVLSGNEAAKMLSTALGVIVHYDQFNERAVSLLREDGLARVVGFSQEQTRIVRGLIEDGIARGVNPRTVARDIRESIGLTESQAMAVGNYRSMLENQGRAPLSESLQRELRDGRSDRSVQRAIDRSTPLPQAQIDSMVERYRDNYVAYRAEVIARTEALRALHQGTEEAVAQVLDSGEVPESMVTRTWSTAGDERVRASHVAMDGQERGVGEDFVSGDGNTLKFPGDPDAPASDVVNCRCMIQTRISLAGKTPDRLIDVASQRAAGLVEEEAFA